MSSIDAYGSSGYSYSTQQTSSTGGNNYDFVLGDEKDRTVSVQDFLNLMVAQLSNQDFMNPMDDTQYVTQLAQFATMQSMQELTYYSQANYVTSLVGKEVTVARLKLGGDVEKVEGRVERISLSNNEFAIYVDGKSYTLSQVMEIRDTPIVIPDEDVDTDTEADLDSEVDESDIVSYDNSYDY